MVSCTDGEVKVLQCLTPAFSLNATGGRSCYCRRLETDSFSSFIPSVNIGNTSLRSQHSSSIQPGLHLVHLGSNRPRSRAGVPHPLSRRGHFCLLAAKRATAKLEAQYCRPQTTIAPFLWGGFHVAPFLIPDKMEGCTAKVT